VRHWALLNNQYPAARGAARGRVGPKQPPINAFEVEHVATPRQHPDFLPIHELTQAYDTLRKRCRHLSLGGLEGEAGE